MAAILRCRSLYCAMLEVNSQLSYASSEERMRSFTSSAQPLQQCQRLVITVQSQQIHTVILPSCSTLDECQLCVLMISPSTFSNAQCIGQHFLMWPLFLLCVPSVSEPVKPSAGACMPRYNLFNTTVPSLSTMARTTQGGSAALTSNRLLRNAGVRFV